LKQAAAAHVATSAMPSLTADVALEEGSEGGESRAEAGAEAGAE